MAINKVFDAGEDLFFPENVENTETVESAPLIKKKEGSQIKKSEPNQQTKQTEIKKEPVSIEKKPAKKTIGRPREYGNNDDKVIENGKVSIRETYYSPLIRFPKELEPIMKILAIEEGYRGGVTEYLNDLVTKDLKKKGKI